MGGGVVKRKAGSMSDPTEPSFWQKYIAELFAGGMTTLIVGLMGAIGLQRRGEKKERAGWEQFKALLETFKKEMREELVDIREELVAVRTDVDWLKKQSK